MLIPEPESPQRSLRGESIRSLRGLLQAAMSLPGLPDLKEEAKEEQRDDKKTKELAVPAAKPIITKPKTVRDADQVRSRLLRNLGISKEVPRQTSPTPPTESNSEAWGPTTEEDLNDIWDVTTLQRNEFANKKLQFHPVVKVIPIPSYKVYSKRIQQTIWTNAYELRENVARNTLEFSFENWEVHKVLDEDNGLIYHNGQWIHPVHVEFVQPEGKAKLTSEEELWILTCDRLGIQPAEFYHSPLPTLQRGSQVSS